MDIRKIVGSIALLLAAVGGAAAQEPATADTLTPLALEGITVSVLRTPISLARAPYSVSVVEAAGPVGSRPGLALDEVLRALPGIQIDNRYNQALGERISIRGSGARAQFGVRGVRILVDGVPATFPDGQTALSHVDPTLVRRAELIRGPASALYGGGSGGVLQLETVLPEVGERLQEAGMMAGSHGLIRGRAAVGGADEGQAYVVRLSYQGYEGARDFSEARNFRFGYRSRHLLPIGLLEVSASAVDYEADNPGSLSEALLAEDRTQAFANNIRQGTGEEGRQAQAGAELRAELGGGEAIVSAYGIVREILNPIPASVIDLSRRVAGVRAAYRIDRDLGTFTFGGEAAFQRDARRNYSNEGGRRAALTLDQDETVDDLALFAQAALRPVEPLTLLGGLRYDHYRFAADDHFTRGDPDDSGRVTMASASPSLGISLRLAPSANLYANVSTAFETPTTTELANRPDGAGGFNPDLRPQQTLAFEGGVKGDVGSTAGYELALFTAEVSDALIPFEVESAPDRQFFRNAGSARHRGVEVGASARPLDWLSGRLAYTYLDATFTDYVVDGDRFDGNRVPGIAPHRLEAVLDVESSGRFAALEGRHVSSMPVDDAGDGRSPAYTVFDVRAGFSSLRAGQMVVEPSIGVQNLLNERYNGSVVVNAFGRRYFEPAPGRTFHVALTVRF